MGDKLDDVLREGLERIDEAAKRAEKRAEEKK